MRRCVFIATSLDTSRHFVGISMVTQISLGMIIEAMVAVIVVEELEVRVMVVDLPKPIPLKRLRVLHIVYLQKSIRPSDE